MNSISFLRKENFVSGSRPATVKYLKTRLLHFLIVNITILIFTACDIPVEQPLYITQNFDKNWEFRKDSIHTDHQSDKDIYNWSFVDLPHDWSIFGDFNKDYPTGAREAFLPAGMGWYRKEFKISERYHNSIISIRFDGIYMNSTVWINGHLLGNRPNGYLEIKYDLTPYLKYDDQINILEVKVDNSDQPNSRWYTGSGIYRHVWLEYTGRIHFDRWGIQITTPEVSKQNSVMSIRSKIINENSEPEKFTLQTLLFSPKGEKIAETEVELSIEAGKTKHQVQKFKIVEPELWSPNNPKVYRVKSTLKKGNKILDSQNTITGIRKIDFDADKGFSLNGEVMKIKGVCIHSTAGAFGAAVPEEIMKYRLLQLKDLGCNAIRFSHNPATPEILNLCDTLGFMVMTEAFDEWEMPKKWGPEYGYHRYFKQWHEKDLAEMIQRDFNHPSIIMYSIGNEIQEQRDGIPRGAEIAKELVEICHRQDPTRPVTAACDQIINANKTGFAQELDIVGYNYQDKYYQEDHKKYPERIILGSETHQYPYTWKKVFQNEYVAGEFLWIGFDYLGEADKYPLKGWENGMFDTTGEIKPRGLLRKTLWNEVPQVYIFSQNTDWKKDTSVFAPWSWEKLYQHWNWPEFKGKVINVKCYTNCDEVELFLNGRSMGTKKMTDIGKLPLKWKVIYQEGKLKAIARKEGKVVAEDVLRTSGKAYKIEIKSSKDKLRDDEVGVFKITVVDKDGLTIPRKEHLIHFRLEGKGEIIAVDNGNLRSDESFRADQRMTFHGKVVCFAKKTGKGSIKLIAYSEGLQQASIIINE